MSIESTKQQIRAEAETFLSESIQKSGTPPILVDFCAPSRLDSDPSARKDLLVFNRTTPETFFFTTANLV